MLVSMYLRSPEGERLGATRSLAHQGREDLQSPQGYIPIVHISSVYESWDMITASFLQRKFRPCQHFFFFHLSSQLKSYSFHPSPSDY